MSEQAVSISLDRDGKIVEPSELLNLVKEAGSVDLTIDAADTPLLTARHLQILVAAERRNLDSSHSFVVANCNEQFESCLSLLGWHPNR